LESFDNVKTYHYYLVTNKHVVEESDAVQIYLHEIDEEIPATLIQYDLKVDIAVVYFEYEEYIRPLEFADVSNLEAGEYVLAIGNPSGFEYSSSATHGIISHPQRYLPDDTDGDGISDWDAEYIQHDAAINPGNSGGPLLNLKGEIIGINTLKFASNEIDNMGFSIPSNTVVPLLEILEKGEVPRRATLGLTSITVKDLIAYPDPNYPLPQGVTYGLYVTDLIAGKAKDAGIRIGDIILSANGKELRNTIDIRLALAAIIVGTDDELRLSVLRDGEIIEFILVY
jgi:serine protease Do